MARCGNHGIVIPRDRELLTRLYWDEGKTTTEIGRIFGTNHKSVCAVLRALGIPTRGRRVPRRTGKCIECGAPTVNIKHAVHGFAYGNRCASHHNAHRAKLQREYKRPPHVEERRRKYMLAFFARRHYGEYAEVWLALRDIDAEVQTRMTKEEIYAANGRRARRRSHNAEPLPLAVRREPEDRSLGDASSDQVRHDASQPG